MVPWNDQKIGGIKTWQDSQKSLFYPLARKRVLSSLSRVSHIACDGNKVRSMSLGRKLPYLITNAAQHFIGVQGGIL